MKKILATALALILIASITISVQKTTQAAGGTAPWPHVRLSATSTSASANNSAALTVNASFYYYDCIQGGTTHYGTESPEECAANGDTPNGEKAYRGCPFADTIAVTVSAEGSGVTLSKTNICGGDAGADSFTVKSSEAGTKTIKTTVGWSYSATTKSEGSIALNFTAAPAAPSGSAAKPKAATAAPAAPASEPPAPAAPTLTTTKIGSETAKTDQPISVEQDKPLVLGGKTIPNGKVTLWVFSDPKQFTTTADKDGNWSVQVTDLPAGSHHAEIEVADPATNKVSPRTKLLEFQVVAAKTITQQTATTPLPKKSSKATVLIVLTAVLVLTLAAIGFLIWKRRRQRPSSTPLNS